MKHPLLASILTLSILVSADGFSQCNPSSIFSNETDNAVCFEELNNVRKCYSNNFPDHDYGPFGGGNVLEAQDFEYSMCLYPDTGILVTQITEDLNSQGCGGGFIFGISMQGVNYSPFARLYWVNPNTLEENTDWHVEADFTLNMDLNGGHVNTLSRYHYHNIPTDYFLNDLSIDGSTHSPILGYAADGFPIYYKHLYTNPANASGGVSVFESGFSLLSGNRPGDGITEPDGAYDGSYIEDYEYVLGQSELDECGGRYGITPEYPNGTYYYVLTDNWPYIPRCFKGQFPDNSFKVGPNCPNSTADVNCANSLPVRVKVLNSEASILSFPNPASRTLNLSLNRNSPSQTSIKIYDMNGKTHFSSSKWVSSIDIHEFSSGIYFIQVDLGSNQLTNKFVVQ